jgi:hypothetical protein
MKKAIYMNRERMQKIDDIIQKWLRNNKRVIAFPDSIISNLIEAGIFSDNEDSLKLFIDEVKKMPKKEQREYLNVYGIGVREIRFKNRECY